MSSNSSLNILLALLCSWVLSSCGGSASSEASKQEADAITVSLPVMKYFVTRLVPECTVNVMVPGKADHDSYTPLPSQMKQMASSKAYIAFGPLEFERTWKDRFISVAPHMVWADVCGGVDLIHGGHHHHAAAPHAEEHDGDEEEEDELDADPHFWLSPKQLPAMLGNVSNALKELYPDQSVRIDSALNVLLGEVSAFDADLQRIAIENPGQAFVIYHPALSYLARDYGFHQLSIGNEGLAPQPLRFAQLIDSAKALGVQVVFMQQGFTPGQVQTTAEALEASIVILQPESEMWPETMTALIAALR